MDPISPKEKLSKLLSKYKYVCIVVLVGLVLMMLPTPGNSGAEQEPTPAQQASTELSLELESILSMIQGVGKVRVLLTQSEGEQVRYVYNEDRNHSGDATSLRRDTVVLSDAQRSEQGLVEQVIPPVYLGAVVVCQGGDNPTVQLHIVNAVSNATGLSTDRITVLKMK